MDKDQKRDPERTQANDEKTSVRNDQRNEGSEQNQLSKEDLPESTNESKGSTGSGQRQDSN